MRTKFLSAVLVLLVMLLVGCSSGPDPMGVNPSSADSVSAPPLGKLGARLNVRWPFGMGSGGWTGVTGDRSPTWTHVGADYYARDLAHGSYSTPAIHAGIAGQVVRVYKSCANVRSGCNGGYGNEVVIYDWNRHVAVRYAHLSFVALDISQGTWVQVGRYLGAMGTSGLSTGPHLHLVSYENIDHFSGGWPVIPSSRDSDHYTCITQLWFSGGS